MEVSTEELIIAATEFEKVADQMQIIVEHLEKIVSNLEDSWQDVGKQVFYQYYEEWHRHMGGFSQVLEMAGKELRTIADDYEKASS